MATRQTATCDDCQHPYAWHYTTYSELCQGCSFEACRCTGFFAYLSDHDANDDQEERP